MLCIWWAEWPLRRPDAPSAKPCLVVDRSQVVAANYWARQLGARSGMRRREGEALCPSGVILERDNARETATFEPVLKTLEDLVPRIEVLQPGHVLIEISGALRFYGGEQALLDQIEKRLDDPLARYGVAGGPFAAQLAARKSAVGEITAIEDDLAFLSSEDIATLDNQDMAATFRWLGISTLGELAQLPRPAVVSRFGDFGLEAHRLASGEDRHTSPRRIEEDLTAVAEFEEPVFLAEQVGFAARALARDLLDRLRGLGSGVHLVEVEARTADGARRHRIWRSADPFTEDMLSERVRWQLSAWMQRRPTPEGVKPVGIETGIVELRLSPANISGDGRQASLLEDTVAKVEVERALARVQSLVGPDQVLEARPTGGRTPTERVAWHRWGEDPHPAVLPAPWPGGLLGPQPALLPPERPRVTIEWDSGIPTRVRLRSRWVSVVNWAGPWRRTGRWWKDEVTVEVYQIVTEAGAVLCEVEGDVAYLTGIYD